MAGKRRFDLKDALQILLIASLLALFSVPSKLCSLAAQETLQSRFEDPFESRVQEFQAAIKNNGQSEWQGEFHAPAGIDEALELLIDAKLGFLYREYGNTGFSNYVFGSLKERNQALTLEIEPKKNPRRSLAHVMIVCRTRDSVFLIPRGQLHGFCLDFREKKLQQHLDGYFSKPANNANIPDGKLLLPSEYEVYRELPEHVGNLIAPKIEALRSELAINLGKKSHVFEGMRFTATIRNDRVQAEPWYLGDHHELRVTRVFDDWAIVVPSRESYRDPSKLEKGIEVRTSRTP